MNLLQIVVFFVCLLGFLFVCFLFLRAEVGCYEGWRHDLGDMIWGTRYEMNMQERGVVK